MTHVVSPLFTRHRLNQFVLSRSSPTFACGYRAPLPDAQCTFDGTDGEKEPRPFPLETRMEKRALAAKLLTPHTYIRRRRRRRRRKTWFFENLQAEFLSQVYEAWIFFSLSFKNKRSAPALAGGRSLVARSTTSEKTGTCDLYHIPSKVFESG